tara:strand:- start:93 stop:503 length:411 start_codon:yes stop_codon:yes gene_type:complete
MKKLTLILFLVLTFSCEKSTNDPLFFTLTIDNQNPSINIEWVTLSGKEWRDIVITNGQSRTFDLQDITWNTIGTPDGLDSFTVSVGWRCVATPRIDGNFDSVMTFDDSRTITVSKPVRDPSDSSPCGCNCYEVTVN